MTYRFPITLIWPPDARIAAPEGQWRRLRSGWLEVTYRNRDELEVCSWFLDEDRKQMELKAV